MKDMAAPMAQQTAAPFEGRTRRWRFLAAAAPTAAAAVALVMSGGSGAIAVAFAGRLPLAISVEKAELAGVSASPGATEGAGVEPALLTDAGHAVLKHACAKSTVSLPVLGEMTLTIGIRRVTASSLKVQAGAVTVDKLSIDKARLRVPVSAGEGGLFQLAIDKASGERLVVRPRAFAVGTIITEGVVVDARRGEHDCTFPGSSS